jgi:hypothetical protein
MSALEIEPDNMAGSIAAIDALPSAAVITLP